MNGKKDGRPILSDGTRGGRRAGKPPVTPREPVPNDNLSSYFSEIEARACACPCPPDDTRYGGVATRP